MGGRGTFAIGNDVRYTYETIGKIGKIKILKGIDGKHGLPEESHFSRAYISLYPNNTVKQIRLYAPDRTAKTDIEFSIHQGKKMLHAHDYIQGIRQEARNVTENEYRVFIKYFGGKDDKTRI